VSERLTQARFRIRAAIRGGGFTRAQADTVIVALEDFFEAFFEAKFSQVVGAMPMQPPSSPK
jgi:hypothetical protein